LEHPGFGRLRCRVAERSAAGSPCYGGPELDRRGPAAPPPIRARALHAPSPGHPGSRRLVAPRRRTLDTCAMRSIAISGPEKLTELPVSRLALECPGSRSRVPARARGRPGGGRRTGDG
jgi:hypothetical protein